jgi:hypothetical protein
MIKYRYEGAGNKKQYFEELYCPEIWELFPTAGASIGPTGSGTRRPVLGRDRDFAEWKERRLGWFSAQYF